MSKVEKYINQKTWLIKENANAGYSFSGLQLHLSEDAISNYLLTDVYPNRISKAHSDGYIYIHDLGLGATVYCLGHDLKVLLQRGINGVPGKVQTSPPKHLRSAINHMINYLFANQSDSAGANAFSNVDTLLAPFVKKDNLDYKEVKQCLQEFIYGMNMPFRVGFQSVFSNVTFDIKCPKMFQNEKPIICDVEQSFTYGELNKEIGMISKAFFEIMMEGDAKGQPFTFPIPTINLHKDFIWDDEVARVIFEATAKYGTPSFQNFINSDLNPDDTYSMCCRLRLNKRELVKGTGGVFGAGASTGSIGVVTMNLPMIGYEALTEFMEKNPEYNEEEIKIIFYRKLERYMILAKESLEIKRTLIEENLKNGMMPYIKAYIKNFDNHFSTIATIGGNELCKNLIKKDLTNKKSQEFILEVLKFMKGKIEDFQEETGNYYNLEQAPAESASFKLAKKLKEKYPNAKLAGTTDTPYLTNSTHMPVDYDNDIISTLKIQEKFNELYNGGTIVHVYLGEKVTDWINCMLLVKKIANNTTLPFFSITPSFSICPIHGYISGEHQYCPLEHTDEQMKKYGRTVIEGESKNE